MGAANVAEMTKRWLFRATVIKWVDGDTTDLDVDMGFYIRRVDRFRLLSASSGGVNTPELHDPDPAVRERAKAAKARVLELCPPGSKVFILTEKAPAQDGFGRWLAAVLTPEGLDVGDTLLAEGLAEVWHRA